MVDFCTRELEKLNIGKTKPEKLLTNAYAEEIYGLEKVQNSTKLLHVILDANMNSQI